MDSWNLLRNKLDHKPSLRNNWWLKGYKIVMGGLYDIFIYYWWLYEKN